MNDVERGALSRFEHVMLRAESDEFVAAWATVRRVVDDRLMVLLGYRAVDQNTNGRLVERPCSPEVLARFAASLNRPEVHQRLERVLAAIRLARESQSRSARG
jgi:hypothetical protein